MFRRHCWCAFFFHLPEQGIRLGFKLLGFCKIDSDLWTFPVFYNPRIAFGMLCMIGQVIFDKTEHRSKKTLFYDQTTKKVSLKISEHVEDRLKISIGGEYLAFHLSADEKSDLLDNLLN